jgi:hypothetical protein
MTQYIHDYFTAHAERAITCMKESQQAQSFYRRLHTRLERGEDLTAEVPEIARVGSAGAVEVVKKALGEYEKKFKAAWDLPPTIQSQGKEHIKMHSEAYEILPRVTHTFSFSSAAGKVTVRTKTAGENLSIEFETPKNKMAAVTAMNELEKAITYGLLAST